MLESRRTAAGNRHICLSFEWQNTGTTGVPGKRMTQREILLEKIGIYDRYVKKSFDWWIVEICMSSPCSVKIRH
jgi:hypothetical protein